MAEGVKILEPKWLFYGLSFFVPVSGLLIGAIYMSKPEEEARDFGKKCLIAAVSYFVVACCCAMTYIGVYLTVITIGLGAGSFSPG